MMMKAANKPRSKEFEQKRAEFHERFPRLARFPMAESIGTPRGQLTSQGCLSCLHKQVKAARAAIRESSSALRNARKFADELTAKQPERAKLFTRVTAELDDAVQQLDQFRIHLPGLPEEQGPGTELHNLLAELGFNEPAGCSCQATIAWMNELGREGCRREIDMIVEKLKAAQSLVSWADLAKGSWQALKKFRSLNLSLLHPVRSLVEEAIRRAEA
jgi:hypothetical protein